MKRNPLFVDSTKMRGDQIQTLIELHQVLVYEGESLVLIIKNSDGAVQRLTMKPVEDGIFKTQTWLEHQETITFQFVIERDGKALLQTKPGKTHAQYAIICAWDPSFTDPPMEAPATSAADIPPSADENSPWPAGRGGSLRNIAEKWGF